VSTAQFASALDKTLARLGRDSLDLYYLHFPYSPRGVGTWMRAMARAVKAGKIRAVGISNCNVAQMRKAAGVLARYGIPLAANQVHYSLMHRKPETDGVLDACRRMDVALVAYRPLGGGAITAGSPGGPGQSALAGTLREVAATRNATPAQVSLAWLLKQDDPGSDEPEPQGTDPRWNSRRRFAPSTGYRRQRQPDNSHGSLGRAVTRWPGAVLEPSSPAFRCGSAAPVRRGETQLHIAIAVHHLARLIRLRHWAALTGSGLGAQIGLIWGSCLPHLGSGSRSARQRNGRLTSFSGNAGSRR
jgi:hypothetical protein